MQSSSLVPAASVRSFRVRAPRPGPSLTLVVAVLLLMLGGLAGALALGWGGQPWLDGMIDGVRGLTGGPMSSAPDDAFDGPIALPVRVPLDPVLAAESAPVAVAELPAATARVESDGGALRAPAPPVGEVPPLPGAGADTAASTNGSPASGAAEASRSAGATADAARGDAGATSPVAATTSGGPPPAPDATAASGPATTAEPGATSAIPPAAATSTAEPATPASSASPTSGTGEAR
jgi:hypothetical protein